MKAVAIVQIAIIIVAILAVPFIFHFSSIIGSFLEATYRILYIVLNSNKALRKYFGSWIEPRHVEYLLLTLTVFLSLLYYSIRRRCKKIVGAVLLMYIVGLLEFSKILAEYEKSPQFFGLKTETYYSNELTTFLVLTTILILLSIISAYVDYLSIVANFLNESGYPEGEVKISIRNTLLYTLLVFISATLIFYTLIVASKSLIPREIVAPREPLVMVALVLLALAGLATYTLRKIPS